MSGTFSLKIFNLLFTAFFKKFYPYFKLAICRGTLLLLTFLLGGTIIRKFISFSSTCRARTACCLSILLEAKKWTSIWENKLVILVNLIGFPLFSVWFMKLRIRIRSSLYLITETKKDFCPFAITFSRGCEPIMPIYICMQYMYVWVLVCAYMYVTFLVCLLSFFSQHDVFPMNEKCFSFLFLERFFVVVQKIRTRSWMKYVLRLLRFATNRGFLNLWNEPRPRYLTVL